MSESDGVNCDNLPAHHENGTLDLLDVQIVLAARNVVRALDADLRTSLDSAGEDTAESVEATLVGGGHHFLRRSRA